MDMYKEKVIKMVDDGQLSRQLYKYRSLSDGSKEYTLDIFRKCELYFSAPQNFNDPFDCKLSPIIGSQKEFAEAMAERQTLNYKKEDVVASLNANPNLLQKFKDAVGNVMNKHGICCFSKKNADLLMWSHYADCHTGICLEFDVKKDPGFFTFPINVHYQDAYPKIDISEEDKYKEYVITLMSTKYLEWSYEEEIRIMKDSNKAYSFKPSALVSVIFGCKVDDAVIEEVKHVVEANPNLKHVKFYKAVMDDTDFKLNILEIY